MSVAQALSLWTEEVPSGRWNVRALRGGLYEVESEEGEVVGVVDVPSRSITHTLNDEHLARLQRAARLDNPVARARILEVRTRLACDVCGCRSWLPCDFLAPDLERALHVGQSLGECRGCGKELHVSL